MDKITNISNVLSDNILKETMIQEYWVYLRRMSLGGGKLGSQKLNSHQSYCLRGSCIVPQRVKFMDHRE